MVSHLLMLVTVLCAPLAIAGKGILLAGQGCKSFGDIAKKPELSILKQYLSAADIDVPEGPLTMLAPNDGAFEDLSDDLLEDLKFKPFLKSVLMDHVFKGFYKASDLMDGTKLTNLNGKTVTVALGDYGVCFSVLDEDDDEDDAGSYGSYGEAESAGYGKGGKQCAGTASYVDIMACSGSIVHIIDAVLLDESDDDSEDDGVTAGDTGAGGGVTAGDTDAPEVVTRSTSTITNQETVTTETTDTTTVTSGGMSTHTAAIVSCLAGTAVLAALLV